MLVIVRVLVAIKATEVLTVRADVCKRAVLDDIVLLFVASNALFAVIVLMFV